MNIEYIYDKWGDLYKKLLSQIPKGNYYDNRAIIVPKKNKHYFKITVNESKINKIHYVAIIREENSGNAKSSFTFVPTSKNYWIELRLSKGLNSICVVDDEDNSATISVTSTYFGLLLNSYAKEVYLASNKLEGIRKDIYVNEATRLVSPVMSFSKEMTENHVLRIFGLQVVLRALINQQGTLVGLENICKGLYVSTPLIDDIEQKGLAFDNTFAGQEYELGKYIRLWIRNSSLIRKSYIMSLANNLGCTFDYTDDKTVIIDGSTCYQELDSNSSDDNPISPEDIGVDSETGKVIDDKKESKVIEITLPKLDRNLPIPFTVKHPWTDKVFVKRKHLDSGTSLDIATKDDPFEKGMIGKQCVPYNYNGSKVTLITKIIQ